MSLSDYFSRHTIHGLLCLGAGVGLLQLGYTAPGYALLGAGVSFLGVASGQAPPPASATAAATPAPA